MAAPPDVPIDRLSDRSGNPLRLLMVHAHPDDETTTTGATAALYAAENISVHLVTCTRGERGEILDEDVRRAVGGAEDREQALGEVRVRELAAAAKALGIEGHRFLGGPGRWWDSGMAGTDANTDPRSLVAADRDEQVSELAAVIRALRPQVLVTYDARGGYGHPDHIRAHELSMAAVRRAADPDAPDAPDAWTVAKVYAAVVPRRVLLDVARSLGSGSDGGNPFARAARALDEGVPEDRIEMPFGVPDHLVTAQIDARDWLPAKTAAMRAHRSQMAANGWFFTLAAGRGGGFGVEYFQLLSGSPGPVLEDGLEADLFAGVRAADDPGCEPCFEWYPPDRDFR
jgi:N-acetyl-1-D-myo-inositol-2-amino-2-deoxy-alpha-D-glucopyranoside deacetylase